MCIVQCIQQGAETEEELVAALTSEFEVDSETAREDIANLLAGLHADLSKA